jgi:hypothetical protein
MVVGVDFKGPNGGELAKAPPSRVPDALECCRLCQVSGPAWIGSFGKTARPMGIAHQTISNDFKRFHYISNVLKSFGAILKALGHADHNYRLPNRVD